MQGVEIPYQESASSGATTTQFKNAVLSLKVTPLITPDNRVILDLDVSDDSVGQQVTSATGGSVPSIDTRQIITQVLVNDGQTVVLGGILDTTKSTTANKVPFFGDIPAARESVQEHDENQQQDRTVDFHHAEDIARGIESLLIARPHPATGRNRPWGGFFFKAPIPRKFPAFRGSNRTEWNMLGKENIFLIGPMGSGKTAVGRHLARLLHFTFHDSDADIEARTGVDIAFIFEKEGEPGFRIREKESIERLTRLESIVLATGGGAVIDADNRRVLAERGVVVYLATSIDQQTRAHAARAAPASC